METRRIVIMPNHSLSTRQAAWFFAIVGGTCLGIAMGFTLAGYWPILPFAGLELFVLGLALGISLRRGRYREVITISSDTVCIDRGTGERIERVEFPLHWASVELDRGHARWSVSRLMIRSGASNCEVASCLTESERRGLWQRLAELIGPVNHTPSPPAKA